MKYPLGPYPNDIIAVASHLPPEGRCLAVALSSVIVVPLPGKPSEPLSRADVLEALEKFKREAVNRITDRAFQVARGTFEIGAVELPTGQETVADVKLELPQFETGDQIQ